MFYSKKTDVKKSTPRALKPALAPRDHTELSELLRECGMDEYLASLASVGVVTINDLGRCSDEIIRALADGRVVQLRKMTELVKAVQKAPKNEEGESLIRMGSMSEKMEPSNLDSPRTPPYSPTGRNLDKLTKIELIKIINEQKNLVTNHQEELISLHLRLENEVKLRYNVQSLVESYKNNERILLLKIDDLNKELKQIKDTKNKYSFEPETPQLKEEPVSPDTDASKRSLEPETPRLSEQPETPNMNKSASMKSSSNHRSSSSSSLNNGTNNTKSPKNNITLRSSGSSIGSNNNKKGSSSRSSAISPPRSKGGLASSKKTVDNQLKNTSNNRRSNSGNFKTTTTPRSMKDKTSMESSPKEKTNRASSPRRLSDKASSNSPSMQTSKRDGDSSNDKGSSSDKKDMATDGVTTNEEKMIKSSKKSPLKARVQAPTPLDTSRPRVSKSSPRTLTVDSNGRHELRSYKPTVTKNNNGGNDSSNTQGEKGLKSSSQVTKASPKTRLSASMPRTSEPNKGINKSDSWNHQNNLGDDTLESKIMRGVTAPEPSFEEKLLSEHRRKSKSQERGGVRKMVDKQESLEDKVITAAYDRWITVNDAEAFKGTGSMVHLFFEGNQELAARVSQHELIEENDGMMKELREVKQEEERKKAVESMKRLVKQKAFTHVILCGVMSGICPSDNMNDSTYLLPNMLSSSDGNSLEADICAFVRRSDVVTFRQSWGKIAQEKQIKISLYAVPDRLTQQQASLYVFSRTQASSLFFFSNSLVDAFTPQTTTLISRLATSGAPQGCHQYVFLPAVSSMIRPLVDESGINEMQDVTIIHSPA